jgi:hypothetical protein
MHLHAAFLAIYDHGPTKGEASDASHEETANAQTGPALKEGRRREGRSREDRLVGAQGPRDR